MTKYVYSFGRGRAEGSSLMRNLLGGKGCELAEMTNLGIPVPPGLTITTQAWAAYDRTGRQFPEGLWEQVDAGIEKLQHDAGLTLGDPANPLLVSVRSGARVSMPGMMDTVLDLGMNAETVEGLAQRTGDRPFALDCYRRFRTMYSDVVLGLDDAEVAHAPVPEDARAQLSSAIEAVFRSWDNPRAVTYRRLHGIPSSWGTAVTVQRMVFGNLSEDSGSGVSLPLRRSMPSRRNTTWVLQHLWLCCRMSATWHRLSPLW